MFELFIGHSFSGRRSTSSTMWDGYCPETSLVTENTVVNKERKLFFSHFHFFPTRDGERIWHENCLYSRGSFSLPNHMPEYTVNILKAFLFIWNISMRATPQQEWQLQSSENFPTTHYSLLEGPAGCQEIPPQREEKGGTFFCKVKTNTWRVSCDGSLPNRQTPRLAIRPTVGVARGYSSGLRYFFSPGETDKQRIIST